MPEKTRVFTTRMNVSQFGKLKKLADEKNQTMTSLVAKAVEEFLDRQSYGSYNLDLNDIRQTMVAIEAIENPVPLSFFLEIIKLRRVSKATTEV